METLGQYRLLRRIAVGGMAEIFLAETTGPGGFSRRVAIKRILPHRATDAEFVEMFLNEARLAKMLSHPHVVQIYDMGGADGTYYIAMEYVPGYDLGQILDRSEELHQTVPHHFVAKLIAQAAAGLHHAHSHRDPNTGQPLNLVHRDISLPNIMVSLQGVVKVLDFGIAKAATDEKRKPTQTGVLKGKISYMSPEYLMGDPIDWRHDLFALGVMLFELLTGQKPFKAKGDVQMLQAILTQEAQDPTQFTPNLDPELVAVVMKLLAKDRDLRYQSGSQIEFDLERVARKIAGHDVTQSQLSQYIQQLFAGSPMEVAPESAVGTSNPTSQAPPERRFTDGQITGDVPVSGSLSNSYNTGYNPPGTGQHQRPRTGHYPQSTGNYNNSTGAGNDYHPPGTGQHQLHHSPPGASPSWQEETRCLDTSTFRDLANGGPLHEPDPTPTRALSLQPDGSIVPLSSMPPASLERTSPVEQFADGLMQENSEAPSLTAPPPNPPDKKSEEEDEGSVLLGVVALLVVLLLGGGIWYFVWGRSGDETPNLQAAAELTKSDAGTPTPATVQKGQQVALKQVAPKRIAPKQATKTVQPTKQAAAKTPTTLVRRSPNPPSPKSESTTITPADNIGGQLLISASFPCPCNVYWKERYRGRTTFGIRLAPGTYTFFLRRKKPYLNYPVRVRVRRGKRVSRHVRLRAVYLRTQLPRGSKVYLGPNNLGSTPLPPMQVYPGVYRVKIITPSGVLKRRTIRIGRRDYTLR